MFAYELASKPCSEATNIGDRLSLWADFGCWRKSENFVGDFVDVQKCVKKIER